MTRRAFLATIPAPLLAAQAALTVPVNQVLDSEVAWTPYEVNRFRSLWSQADGDLRSGGIRLETSVSKGGVSRPPYREPIVTGLRRQFVNVVVTREIPQHWTNGRVIAGVTTLYRGFHLCMIGLNHAHGNRVPYLAVNTCLHELLHALLLDIYERRPRGLHGDARESRVDFHATNLWLFGAGGAVRGPAAQYLSRLRL